MTRMHGAPPARPGARWFRLLSWNRAKLDADIDEELAAHITMRVEYLTARGRSRADAEREARARFGDFDAARRRLTRSARKREARMQRRQTRDELVQDLHLGLRLFRRKPLFFAATVATLAVGIGANAAVFSILRASLLQPLPYERPGDLALVWRTMEHPPAASSSWLRSNPFHLLTTPTILAWRERMAPQVGEIAALLSWQGNLDAQFDLMTGDRAERLHGAYVTPNLFTVLGVRAERGRLFTARDEREGAPLVVLSRALWERDFGADPAIVGKPLTLTVGIAPREPRTFIVAGILPRGFHFTYPDETEVWAMMPWSGVAAFEPRAIAFRAVVRLRDGVSLDRARSLAAGLREGMATRSRPEDREIVGLESMQNWVTGEIRPSLLLLGGVATLLLLMTCATVANGLLARVSARQRELAVRAALGAGRARLVRQLLTEGALISLAGAVLGIVLAIAVQPILRSLLPASVPRVGELSVSPAILAFGAAIATVSALLAAVAPAWAGTPADGARQVHAAAATTPHRAAARWRQILVATQGALATALLISAVLLLSSLWRLGHVPVGFDGERVLTLEMRLLDPRYRQPGALAAFQDELMRRVRAIPGVLDAGLTSAVPFRGVDFMLNLGRPGATQGVFANGRYVDAGYFSVLRVPLLRGRLITDADREGATSVAVISESFARRAFGDEDPIGKLVETSEVVGIVGDVRYVGFEKEPGPAIYYSRAQHPSALMCIVARTSSSAATVAPAFRRAIRELDPGLPAMNLTTIDQILDESLSNRRFYTLSTVAFAGIAVLLTIAGLAVVVARVVAERRRELAIRAALGATMRHLAVQASRDAMLAVAAGIVVGAAAAYVEATLLSDFLFEVAPHSPRAFGGVISLTVAVAALAAWLPVRRLARLPIAATLRAD